MLDETNFKTRSIVNAWRKACCDAFEVHRNQIATITLAPQSDQGMPSRQRMLADDQRANRRPIGP
jgi:hypothetical protein